MAVNFGDPLSDREAEVAQCAANGFTNEEIGILLDIHPDTVKVHLRTVFKKLGVKRRNLLLLHFQPSRTYEAPTPDTDHDRQLLDYMADGLTDAEIASKMQVEPSMIHGDVMRLRRETSIASRNELAMWWMIKCGRVKTSPEPLPKVQQALISGRVARSRKSNDRQEAAA